MVDQMHAKKVSMSNANEEFPFANGYDFLGNRLRNKVLASGLANIFFNIWIPFAIVDLYLETATLQVEEGTERREPARQTVNLQQFPGDLNFCES
jgi:hypothetical protein